MKNTKTKKVRFINKKTMIATFDIGKIFHYAYFRAPGGKDIKPFIVYNFRKDFNRFWTRLCQFKRENRLDDIVIGFESSGPYAEPLFHYLRKKPVKLVQINPMHSKRLKELTGNSPNKTDKKDPRVIADVISLGHALTLVVPKRAAAQLRRLSQARERAMKRRTAALNQLQDLIFIIFPEFLFIMKNISTKTASYLIKRYPTPEGIVALGIEPLATIIKKISHGKLRRRRAQELFEAASSSIGVTAGRRSILMEIEYLISQIGADNKFIANLEKQMEKYLQEIPYSNSILSIKGIGIVTVAGLIGEVGDFKKFNTISEIMKLAGLDLYEVSSGKHEGQRRISKRGRSLMRKLLYFAAINAVKTNGIMHEPYQKMLERGTPKIKALIAISRKLLRIAFALARDDAVYVENHSNIPNQIKLAA
jgi:transposase